MMQKLEPRSAGLKLTKIIHVDRVVVMWTGWLSMWTGWLLCGQGGCYVDRMVVIAQAAALEESDKL